MKVVKMETFKVSVPYSKPFVTSIGVVRGTSRTIVHLETDEGIDGWGETRGGSPTQLLIKEAMNGILGADPLSISALCRRLSTIPFYNGYNGAAAVAGIEMACWDIMGRKFGVPLYILLGGKVRDAVPLTGVMTEYGYQGRMRAFDLHLSGILDCAHDLVSAKGFGVLKYKGSDFPFDHSIKALKKLREEIDDEVLLRIDPNGVWPVEFAVNVMPQMRDLGIEFVEDPVEGISAMSRVRHSVPIPLATNMCVTRLSDIPPAVEAGAVDIILGDCHMWGGISVIAKLASTCEAFNLGVSIHSGGELGLSTVANIHMATAMPQVNHAVDTLYHILADDILTERLKIENGSLRAPSGPGLGVQVDREKLALYEKLNQEKGDFQRETY